MNNNESMQVYKLIVEAAASNGTDLSGSIETAVSNALAQGISQDVINSAINELKEMITQNDINGSVTLEAVTTHK